MLDIVVVIITRVVIFNVINILSSTGYYVEFNKFTCKKNVISFKISMLLPLYDFKPFPKINIYIYRIFENIWWVLSL